VRQFLLRRISKSNINPNQLQPPFFRVCGIIASPDTQYSDIVDSGSVNLVFEARSYEILIFVS
jgi:hypothetical protein